MKETLQINLPKGKFTFDRTNHLNLICYGNNAIIAAANVIDALMKFSNRVLVKYVYDLPSGMVSAALQGCTGLNPYEGVSPLLQKRFVTDDYISSSRLFDDLELYRIYKDIDNDVDILYDNLQNYYSSLYECFHVPYECEDDDWKTAKHFFRQLKSYCRDYAHKHIFYVIYVSDYDMSKILYFLNNATVLGIHFILICDKVGIISEELIGYCGLRLITESDSTAELKLLNQNCDDNTASKVGLATD